MSYKHLIVIGVVAAVILTVAASNQGTSRDMWQDSEYTTNMWQLISSGNVDELKSLIESNQELVNIRASDGRGPLWWAYEYGQHGIVKLLLDNGANPDERDADGKKASELSSVGPTEFMKNRQDTYPSEDEESPAKNYHGEEFDEFE
mmetsp:Transcript_65350/g.76007  ORF Transcript_65350/g.76007 Transcript_65350/m.76007 type:complete len:147 (+) Transcript_65350:29-469(+)|eukprot:CAMPEP_0176433150 /NCGR_PEP_ID=MMETSP0127-20121128/15835_1 /TAXON_ID=938130 /ORGANISM="Platyophrya macrostoma, Strain WH" /LENGTH=146 /DNA_ID=CAMNT_0017815491 /DNA_START=116 /DNA_END=556 /DNA_ORIENTATION=-